MMQPSDDQRRGGKTKFLRAEQRGDRHVAAGFQLAVRLDINAAAQIVQHERLVRFGQAEFPRAARVLDGRQRRRARAAVVAGNQHHVRVRLGHARRDRADADFGDELHADARVAIGIFQIVDQLRQIFDGINVMMRRRRNQTDARRRAAHFGDRRINFFAGQFAAFAGLRALRHFDLQFLRVDQIMARHAETSADATCLMAEFFESPFGIETVARRVFAAFAGVATCRRCGSSRWPALRALPWRWSRSSSRRS